MYKLYMHWCIYNEILNSSPASILQRTAFTAKYLVKCERPIYLMKNSLSHNARERPSSADMPSLGT